MSDIDKLADDELAKYGITKKKPKTESRWDDDALLDPVPGPRSRAPYGAGVYKRGTSWEPPKQPAYTPPRSQHLGPRDRLCDLAKEAWKKDTLTYRGMDKIVTIVAQEVAILLRLADLEPETHAKIYMDVEAMVRKCQHWSGIGKRPAKFGEDDEQG